MKSDSNVENGEFEVVRVNGNMHTDGETQGVKAIIYRANNNRADYTKT